jgi:hypothetical protein
MPTPVENEDGATVMTEVNEGVKWRDKDKESAPNLFLILYREVVCLC